ncbi:50S ribosomal protein L25/general stress protein Ctc [Entomomonas sp. E2T0]|uniref:50S ribosomal protein L25/general stress protein Ctc n=1 Tax=Entomomonas sp. E2T0 TaxID=2930213 RepID=UPI0022284067|nr:50S ribosomal protein L25/general stress protein Ctc [Entomomonas sp. E2T0]UYZ84528.1 50S ribosomal protein L25/general stress protein Ctc [Entomomonas sp. E2T0]
MVDFIIDAQARDDLGKGASRRLRRNASMVPGIIYGGDKAPKSVSVLAKDLAKLLENEAVFSHILTVNVAGQKESVLIKALQRHPAKGFVLHIDFQRMVAGQKITTTIPLHFINEATAIGVKQDGGEISHITGEVEISCLPKDLPEFIEVDMANVELDQIVHLSDLKAPKGVELVALAHNNDLPVATIHTPRVQSTDEAATGGETPTAE